MADRIAKRARGGRPLVLSDPTVLVRRANERIVVSREKVTVAAVPIAELSHVAVHGPVTLTGAALAGLLDAGVDVTLYSSAGFYRGTVSSARSGNVYLLLAQMDAWKRDDRRRAYAVASLGSKIAGQRAVMQRQAIDRGSAACREAARRLMALERAMADAESVDAARGVEGAAAAVYFDAFGEMLSGAWTWRGRVRHPATDPVNAMLSYGYALATGELSRLLAWNGFDARIGLVHGLRYGRESLALDAVEEFRAPLVDRFVLRVVNRRQFTAGDFAAHDEDGSVRLTPDARRRFLELWEEAMSVRAPVLPNERELAEDLERDPATRVTRDVGGAGGGGGGGGVVVVPGMEAGADRTWQGRMERQIHRLRRFVMRGARYVGMLASRADGAVEEVSRAEDDGEDDGGEPEGDQ